MNKQINLIVEGTKDAYFLYEFLSRRFGSKLTRQSPPSGGGLSYKAKESLMFKYDKEFDSLLLCIHYTGGYNQPGPIRTYLTSAEKGYLLECAAIIFDSDMKGTSDDAGQTLRRGYLESMINGMIAELRNDNLQCASEVRIFLFPDNVNDGDLESVLYHMAYPLHRSYFSLCWRVFQFLLSACSFLRLSNKSMIYDYVEAMYDKTDKVAKVKDKQGYDKNMRANGLWKWDAKELQPLYDFIDKILAEI